MKQKIITTMISIALLLSAMVFEAGATPGKDEWGISTDDLSYDKEAYVDVEINTSTLKNNTKYNVLYPVYSGYPYSLSWHMVMAGGSPVKLEVGKVTPTSTEHLTSEIILNVSGMWVLLNHTIDPGELDGNNFDELGAGYFWVNSTQKYAITLSDDEATYGINKSIDITVTKDESAVACWVDVIRVSGDGIKTKVVHRYEHDGAYTLDTSRLKWAGEYIVQAYRDVDDQTEHGYMEGQGYYSDTYGKNMSATNYYYKTCGPWDPPEWNADSKIITVEVGKPTTSIPEANKMMCWGFDGEVNISVENYDGGVIQGINVTVYNSDEEDVTSYLSIGGNAGYIRIGNKDAVNKANISRITGGWGRDMHGKTYGENGTWYAYVFKDIDGDGIEEWNATVEFEVGHAPGIQWIWVDDDGNISSNNNDGVIPEIPDIEKQPLKVSFQIIGEDHSYYGGEQPKDFGGNITVSGNALFLPKTADEIHGVTYSEGTWTIPLIPTMSRGGGNIVFSVNWKEYGKHTETLNVGGSKNNGTVVSISPPSFVISEDVEITVTVSDSAGTSFMNAEVSLYWIKDGKLQGRINHTAGKGDINGRYTFMFNTSDQTKGQKILVGEIKAPRDIAAYVKLFYGSPDYIYGYATAKMNPKNDLVVSLSKAVVMAGEKTKLWMNTSIYSPNNANKTYPNKGDGLQIELYNESGKKVELNEDFGSIKDSDLVGVNNSLNGYFLKPGEYTVYVHNNTHDSTGHNATLLVKAVDITCDKSPFIWRYDKDINATFTVKYDGNPVDGKLRIYNMTDEGDHYGAWFDTGTKSLTFDVVNGVVTIDGINVSNLPDDKARENITFDFKPEKSGSKFAQADGVVPVKIPDVSATPKAIPYNKPAHLTVKVTGRGNVLEDVGVGLEIPGMATETKLKTDSRGEALFSFMPLTTGIISINIENRTSDTTVMVTSWSLYIDVPRYVDERNSFTVKIRNGSADGQEVKGVAVTFDGKTQVGDYTFTAPSVKADMQYTIEAQKEGHAGDTVTILVVNVPQLMIIVDTGEITAGKTFTVCVADDEGRAIIGATVTFNGKTYLTGSQGIATLSMPSGGGKHTVTATKEGFASATISIEAGVVESPGFEILVLIAALGIAFILLRRRRK